MDSTKLDLKLLKATFNSMPGAIVIANAERRIISVNNAFETLFGYSENEIVNNKTAMLFKSGIDFTEQGQAIYNPQAQVPSDLYEVIYQRKDGSEFIGEIVSSVIKDQDGDTIGYLDAIRDPGIEKHQTGELETLSKRLELLVKIVTRDYKDIDAQINEALKLTAQLLDFEIGIVSSISGADYTVEYYYPAESDLEEGMRFNLENTYCSITYDADDVLTIEHMKESPYKGHPCYQLFELESYIGIPLSVDGKRFGTVNFSSTQPRDEPFAKVDRTFLRLLGDWLSTTLERRRIQKELYKSREKYRLISQRAADLVCLHDADGTYEFVSPSVKNILGYKPKDLLGSNPYLLIHPDDREIDLKAKAKEGNHKVEYRIQKKNGQYIWFETSTELITEDGVVTKYRTGSRDITERKKLELLLKDTNQLASVGGWEYDIESGELFWTDEIYRIHELPIGSEFNVEQAIGFFDPAYRSLVEEKFGAAIEHGEGYDIELALITARGNRKWVRAIGKAQTDEKGAPYKVYGVFQDLTERKKMEDKLVAQNEKLQNLVRATNKINSVIGHDLRTPLNTLIGFSDLLLRDIEDDEENAAVRKKLDIIYNTSKNMSRLLNDLLDWSRMQTGDMNINLEMVSIPEIITSVIDVLNPVAQQKNIIIKADTSRALNVRADQHMITTVIRNFLSNAIKFSNAGDTINVYCGNDKNRWFISVKDEGEGMPEEIMSKLFDPDYHPSKRGTNREKGTGLGLRLCNQLVEKHHGYIEVESELEKGSTFTAYIPMQV